MLTHISFENFKSWASLKMPFGSVTGIFGPNSSGKTSIIQFLLLLKQTREATDREEFSNSTATMLNSAQSVTRCTNTTS